MDSKWIFSIHLFISIFYVVAKKTTTTTTTIHDPLQNDLSELYPIYNDVMKESGSSNTHTVLEFFLLLLLSKISKKKWSNQDISEKKIQKN